MPYSYRKVLHEDRCRFAFLRVLLESANRPLEDGREHCLSGKPCRIWTHNIGVKQCLTSFVRVHGSAVWSKYAHIHIFHHKGASARERERKRERQRQRETEQLTVTRACRCPLQAEHCKNRKSPLNHRLIPPANNLAHLTLTSCLPRVLLHTRSSWLVLTAFLFAKNVRIGCDRFACQGCMVGC